MKTATVGTLRVVLDTNVVVSALLFSRGRLAWLRQAWQQGRFIALISRPVAEELMAVLAYPKFKLNSGEQRELLADYLPWCEIVSLPPELPAVADCRDTDDLKFLALAQVARADFLVSGDKDLLALAPGHQPPIINADDFRQRIEVP